MSGDQLTLCLSLPQQPVITLEGSLSCTFSREGISTVTVQVSAGNTILQDRKNIVVHGEPTLMFHLQWDSYTA